MGEARRIDRRAQQGDDETHHLSIGSAPIEADMGRHSSQHSKAAGSAEKTRSRVPAWLPLVGGLLALGIMIAMAVYALRKNEVAPEAAQPVAEEIQAPARTVTAKAVDVDRLVGRWLRPDGNYVLEIRSAGKDGKVDAAYFNPNPINVSKAEVSSEEGKTHLFVEMRDRGYEGNYYTLTYDPGLDRLAGVYHQLSIGQEFEVEFVRIPR
jgi:hypothetical protein